jgi:hypothetical protein
MAPGQDFIGAAGVHAWRAFTPAYVPTRRLGALLGKAAAGTVIRRERRGGGRVETTKRRSCR